MQVVLFGATGMVGSGVLLECLDSPRVASVLAIGRNPTRVQHSTLRDSAPRQTENELLALPFKAAYMFRPGYIQPLRGVRSNEINTLADIAAARERVINSSAISGRGSS